MRIGDDANAHDANATSSPAFGDDRVLHIHDVCPGPAPQFGLRRRRGYHGGRGMDAPLPCAGGKSDGGIDPLDDRIAAPELWIEPAGDACDHDERAVLEAGRHWQLLRSRADHVNIRDFFEPMTERARFELKRDEDRYLHVAFHRCHGTADLRDQGRRARDQRPAGR